MGDNWKDNSVMFVFECPAGNIDASFLNDRNTEEYSEENRKHAVENATAKSDSEKFKLHLAKVLWHADPKIEVLTPKYSIKDFTKSDYCKQYYPFAFFGKSKRYSELMLSIILTFKLKNFYTTNMFRYEIFSANKNGVDVALNMNGIVDIQNDVNKKVEINLITETFKEE